MMAFGWLLDGFWMVGNEDRHKNDILNILDEAGLITSQYVLQIVQ